MNSGSNTLSFFRIDPVDVLHPKLVGTPVDTLGEFPISVTYSAALKQGTNSLTCSFFRLLAKFFFSTQHAFSTVAQFLVSPASLSIMPSA